LHDSGDLITAGEPVLRLDVLGSMELEVFVPTAQVDVVSSGQTVEIALGTAIMVPGPVMGGLAIALIFGSMSSALFVVFIVPLLYRYWSTRA
jgi:hypothetical protein